MNILGVAWGTCSTAAVMCDGRIVASVSEERFSRRKNDERYPKAAIEQVLALAGLAPADLDLVAFAGETFDPVAVLHRKYSAWSVADRLREQQDYWWPRLYQQRDVSFFDVFADKIDEAQFPGQWGPLIDCITARRPELPACLQDFRRDAIVQHLGIDPRRIEFVNHHRCHAHYAYYGSPLDKQARVLILTADGSGDGLNATVSVAEGGEITTLSRSANCNLARLYRYTTLLLGMKPDEHEHKVMGLAAYASPESLATPMRVFTETMRVAGLGFDYHVAPRDFYYHFKERLDGCRFDAIAGGLQAYTETMLTEWARNGLRSTGARRLCLGGGVAMNVKAMMRIAGLDEVDDLFVCPSPSDESLAAGACYVAMHDRLRTTGCDPRARLHPLADAYLGPAPSAADVRAAVATVASRPGYVVHDRAAPSLVARLLAEGRIVARCAGRSEFGARALGNRSILADPRDLGHVRAINSKIKSRDFWMPFAPAVLDHRADEYLDNPKQLRAPFMTVAFGTHPAGRRALAAALHQADLTCRPQIVTAAVNPGYHALLSAFETVTGSGGLLNTSFNMHGEPIVQTAADAVDVLERSGLDALMLDEYLIEKRRARTTGEGDQ